MNKGKSKLEPTDEIHEELSFVEFTFSVAMLELRVKPVEQVQKLRRGNRK